MAFRAQARAFRLDPHISDRHRGKGECYIFSEIAFAEDLVLCPSALSHRGIAAAVLRHTDRNGARLVECHAVVGQTSYGHFVHRPGFPEIHYDGGVMIEMTPFEVCLAQAALHAIDHKSG